MDGKNSAVRYYKNNFCDGFRQVRLFISQRTKIYFFFKKDGLDIFLGNYVWDEHRRSPFQDSTQMKVRIIPILALVSFSMCIIGVLLPPSKNTKISIRSIVGGNFFLIQNKYLMENIWPKKMREKSQTDKNQRKKIFSENIFLPKKMFCRKKCFFVRKSFFFPKKFFDRKNFWQKKFLAGNIFGINFLFARKFFCLPENCFVCQKKYFLVEKIIFSRKIFLPRIFFCPENFFQKIYPKSLNKIIQVI